MSNMLQEMTFELVFQHVTPYLAILRSRHLPLPPQVGDSPLFRVENQWYLNQLGAALVLAHADAGELPQHLSFGFEVIIQVMQGCEIIPNYHQTVTALNRGSLEQVLALGIELSEHPSSIGAALERLSAVAWQEDTVNGDIVAMHRVMPDRQLSTWWQATQGG